MALITKPVDRAIGPMHRYQYYDGITNATEITINFKIDLGRPAKTGFIINNDSSAGITIYLNYSKDIDGSMQGIPMTASDRFSFDIHEIPVSDIKITGTDVDVDIFVS